MLQVRRRHLLPEEDAIDDLDDDDEADPTVPGDLWYRVHRWAGGAERAGEAVVYSPAVRMALVTTGAIR